MDAWEPHHLLWSSTPTVDPRQEGRLRRQPHQSSGRRGELRNRSLAVLIELERQLERRRGGLGEVARVERRHRVVLDHQLAGQRRSRWTSVTSSNAASHIKPSIPLSLRTSPRRWPTNTTSIDGTRCRVSDRKR